MNERGTDQMNGLEIAIIAMDGRFPGARNLDEFWDNLAAGRESVRAISDADYLAGGGDPAGLADPYLVKVEAALDDIEYFDAAFFGYRPPEAELMDPQHRLFLECAYHTLEQAGYATDGYEGAIGVYAGASFSKYLLFNVYPRLARSQDSIALMHALSANANSGVATRVSYELDLKGPSVFVQTACSTSLVAVHMACQDLLNYRCDMALAGGVAVNPTPRRGYRYVQGGPLSADGHCRAFDAASDGTVPGDGVGIVLLKRLGDALADGDAIRAVIKGSAVNNDGNRKVGFSAPSVAGQVEAILAAHAVAGVDAESISYIEAHGTGTPVGDPIEVTALCQAFGKTTTRAQFCAVGSIKTNIGHLDAAAGVAGLIKAVLALERKMLPPSLHFRRANPLIDFEGSPFYVNTRLVPWPGGETGRRAGVSSFGIGGTNAHVIVEEAPAAPPSEPAEPWSIMVLSASTASALEASRQSLGRYVSEHPELNIADAAYTLQRGRRTLPYRQAIVCRDARDAADQLLAALGPSAACQEAARPSVVFMFPGAGTEYNRMGRELYEREPVFREEMDRCAAILHGALGLDLRKAIDELPDPAEETEVCDRDGRPRMSLPMVLATEYALAKLLMRLGVKPTAFIGHSLGEYTAACLAGVFSLEEVLPLVVERERLLRGAAGGGLSVNVSLGREELGGYLTDGLSLAAVNASNMCLVSGREKDIELLEQRLARDGVEHRRLRVGAAVHSYLMDPVLDEYERVVAKVTLREPEIPFISNVTGTWIKASEATDPSYWRRHSRQPVQFAAGLDELMRGEDPILLEVGPGQSLRKLAERHMAGSVVALSSMRHARAAGSDVRFLREAVAQLWTHGVDVDWRVLHAGQSRRRVALPGYPFERHRYWIDPPSSEEDAVAEPASRTATRSLLSIPTWVSSPLPETGTTIGPFWLIFSDAGGIGDALARQRAEQGAATIIVRRGGSYARLGDRSFAIDPGRSEDYSSLSEALAAIGSHIQAAVYLWSMEPDFFDGAGPGELHAVRIFDLCASMLARRGEATNLWVVANCVLDVAGDEPISRAKRLAPGLCQAISDEYPGTSCHLLDLGAMGSACTAGRIASKIVEEIACSSAAAPVIAHRGARRWVPAWEPWIPVTSAPADLAHDPEATVLIPGGLRRAAFPFAKYMACAAPVHIIVTDELNLPDRSRWHEIAHPSVEQAESDPRPGTHARAFMSDEWPAIEQAEQRLRQEIRVESIPAQLEADLDRLCGLYVCDLLRGAGLGVQRGCVQTRRAIAAALRMRPKFEKFLDALLRMLVEDRFVEIEGDEVRFIADAAAEGESDQLKQDIAARYPDFVADLDVNERCVRQYPQVFSGEVDGLQVILPDGDYERVRPVIDNRMKSSHMAIYRPLIAEAVAGLVRKAGGRKVRILEVGAGRGDLTWLVVDALREFSNVEYNFTDIGRSFVLGAQRRARDAGIHFMEFGVLDISRDPGSQGYELGSFDMVLAFNVLHATPDLRESLGHVRELLVPDGVVFVLEAARSRRWLTMTGGLAEGWWYFDDGIRKHSPLIEAEQWVLALQAVGYEHVTAYPKEHLRDSSDYSLIVAGRPRRAEADGETAGYGTDAVRGEIQRRIRRVQLLEKLGARVSIVPVAGASHVRAALAATAGQSVRGLVHVIGGNCRSWFDVEREIAEIRTLEKSCTETSHRPSFVFLVRPVATNQKPSLGDSTIGSYAAACIAERHEEVAGSWTYIEWNDRLPEESEELPPNAAVARSQRGTTAFHQVLQLSRRPPALRVAPPFAPPVRNQESTTCAGGTPEANQRARISGFNQRPHLETPFVPPTTDLETAVARIWEEHLGLDRVGLNDGLFELGGDSLLAMRIVAKLRDASGANISLRKFLQRPTVAGAVAEVLAIRADQNGGDDRRIVPSPRRARAMKPSDRPA